jgi:hypothetical protein
VITAAIAIKVKTIVAPVAKLKAAPGFRTRVSWKNEPKISTGLRAERLLTAQILEDKSSPQISAATK